MEIMDDMFLHAPSFNAGISKWDVSSVNIVNYKFSSAKSFNRGISKWDVLA